MTSTVDASRNDRDDADETTATLDRISLRQALIDVEVANARVVDLTARLTDSHAEVARLRAELAAASAPAPAPQVSALRRRVAPGVKAVARRTLPLSVRTAIRRLIG